MKISWRRAAQGAVFAVMAGCGTFLFTLMSAEELDENLVLEVCLTGSVAGVTCVSELITVTKEQKRRRTQSLLTKPILASA